MVVLAIDVGLRVSGYTVCEVKKLDIGLIKEGEVKPRTSDSLPKRLFFIYSEFIKVIKTYKPQVMILERLYSHHRHPTTVSSLSQVRGVVLVLAEKFGLEFYEFSPTRARKSFLGKGNADSSQVKKMAENILSRKFISEHTADAFSLVVAFSHELKVKKLKDDWKNQG